ncbi:hypothetical protein PHLCEN_2v9806 [Hermanssonia centrifuga]|uniref:F-box domain-containing protein n=1 Tax=Hermanssonia centrifuga TaxID=98765 RepID=A0A2R6NPX7_9APHY|nr:hypothetical protein PHLCEN_2v9806 [Hermanssonia centrifuga]
MKSLPVEVLEMICEQVPRPLLPSVMQCNILLYTLACRVLYRNPFENLKMNQRIRLLKTLSDTTSSTSPLRPRSNRISHPRLYVRVLRLDFTNNLVSHNLLRLIQRVLRSLPALLDLYLEFSPKDNRGNLSWVLDGLNTSLHTPSRSPSLRLLSTSIRCDQSLSRFLASQPGITELSLRGFATTEPFKLPPSALPNLSAFRIVHLSADVLGGVLEGRPVKAVAVTLFPGDCWKPLDALKRSTVEVKRLTVLVFDDESAQTIFGEVSRRVRGLEALHVVGLMASYSAISLLATAPILSRFPSLRYLTFMAGDPVNCGSPPCTIDDERRVAGVWSKACPTLQTIILPKGQVWYESEGIWCCCGSDSIEGA